MKWMGKENDVLQVNTNTIFRVFFKKGKWRMKLMEKEIYMLQVGTDTNHKEKRKKRKKKLMVFFL